MVTPYQPGQQGREHKKYVSSEQDIEFPVLSFPCYSTRGGTPIDSSASAAAWASVELDGQNIPPQALDIQQELNHCYLQPVGKRAQTLHLAAQLPNSHPDLQPILMRKQNKDKLWVTTDQRMVKYIKRALCVLMYSVISFTLKHICKLIKIQTKSLLIVYGYCLIINNGQLETNETRRRGLTRAF